MRVCDAASASEGCVTKIRDVQLVPLLAPLPAGGAYGMARGLATARQATIVRLSTDDGAEGIGEVWGPPAITRAALDLVRPYLIGREVYDFEHVMSLVLAKHYHFGVQNQIIACLGGLDMAMLDAIGKLHGVPVAKLLGGIARTRLPFYASGGYLTEQPERDFPAQLERLAAAGAGAAKIKIGLGPSSDTARVRAARQALGDDALLMVDANGNYTLDAAIESMRRIAAYDIHWFEEPLAPQDFAGYAALRRRGPIPLATGEALYTAWDFKRLLDAEGVDIVQPDLTQCGGVRAARDIALLARLHHVRLSPHVWGAGVGLAAACHFVASLPHYPHNGNIPYPTLIEYDVGENPLRDGILALPVQRVDGFLLLPEGPGLGIELDEHALARHRADL
jgi:D-galactarolactone cycloisomerase